MIMNGFIHMIRYAVTLVNLEFCYSPILRFYLLVLARDDIRYKISTPLLYSQLTILMTLYVYVCWHSNTKQYADCKRMADMCRFDIKCCRIYISAQFKKRSL